MFQKSTELARYYIRELMKDGCEHGTKEIADYVLDRAKNHEGLDKPVQMSTVTTVLWQMAKAGDGSFTKTKRGVYQMGIPKKEMTGKPTCHDRAIRSLIRAEREIVGSFYRAMEQDPDFPSAMNLQKECRNLQEQLGKMEQSLAASGAEYREKLVERAEETEEASMEMALS